MVSRRVRRRRRQVAAGGVVLVLIVILVVLIGGGGRPTRATISPPTRLTASELSPGWRGNGHAVTLAFGGDVHFEGSLATGLANSPSTALAGVPGLVAGSAVSMGNLQTAVTDGTCPAPQPKPYVFYAPATAFSALHGAGLSLMNSANNHAEDCGAPGLQMTLSQAGAAAFPLVGIGQTAAAASAPHVVTVGGQRVAVLGATQLFDPGLQAAWTAGPSRPGVASALDEASLVAAVQSARRVADTVVVFLTWGSDGRTCPTTVQPPLARALVRAGADIVVGSGAHVQLGAGYLGSALVDYGLGNLAFYDNDPPESDSGSLLVTVTGRHVDRYSWRPAVLSAGLPRVQTGPAAATAVRRWSALRACTGLSASAGASVADRTSETTPLPASAAITVPPPARTTLPGSTTTATTAASSTTSSTVVPSTTAPVGPTTPSSTTTTTTTTTLPPTTTTTNNAG